jgi:hypothetical protein
MEESLVRARVSLLVEICQRAQFTARKGSMADRIRRVALAAIALPVLFLVMSGLASAATFIVGSPAGLNTAIFDTNSFGGVNTINIAANNTLTSALSAIASGNNLTINGNGFTLDGDNKFQIFTVNSAPRSSCTT